MIQVAACGDCGRYRPIHDLAPVEVYDYISTYGGAVPRPELLAVKMFCGECRERMKRGGTTRK